MMRSIKGSALVALAVGGVLAFAPASASAANTGLEVYKIQLKDGQLQELAKAGYDVTEARVGDSIEVAATAGQAAKLQRKGFDVTLKRNKRGETVDDAALTVGATTTQTGFEADLGEFTAGPAPDGSENGAQWTQSASLGYATGPGVATADSIYWGFGFEGISTNDQRTAVMRSAMQYFGAL